MRLAGTFASIVLVGITARTACARVSSARELSSASPQRLVPDDTLALARLLGTVRGVDPFLCELATRAVDMHGSWSQWGPFQSNPLERDSTSAALIDWIQTSHNDPAVIPRLRAGMRDADACVRRVAGSFLGRIEHPAAVEALLAALDDPSADTRVVAVIGLGFAEKPQTMDALSRRLRDDSPAVRRVAAWALGALEDAAALPALIEVLQRDTDPRVRQAAAWAIGEIDG